jgi:hypothetical protein
MAHPVLTPTADSRTLNGAWSNKNMEVRRSLKKVGLDYKDYSPEDNKQLYLRYVTPPPAKRTQRRGKTYKVPDIKFKRYVEPKYIYKLFVKSESEVRPWHD